MKNYIKIALGSVLAGIMIGLGGVVYLSMENKVLGALFFSIGLLTVCYFQLNLFTGKIGYLIERIREDKSYAYLAELAITWLGNLVGTWLTAEAILHSRRIIISEKAAELCQIKVGDSLSSILLLGIFCGMLMFIAVEVYKTSNGRTTWGIVMIIFCVTVFIMSGFEHCIANMFYASMARTWSIDTVLMILAATVGNTIGAVAFHAIVVKREK